jgi:hypothetical protein
MPEELGSWTDGSAKSAIVEFVRRVTAADGDDHVAPADRIAVVALRDAG